MKKKKSEKKILLITFIIFLIAFGVRFINLEAIKDNPFFNYPIMDEKYHDVWAEDIVGGDVFGNVPFYRAPAYPYFLGLIYSIFGQGYYIPRLIGIIIGSLSCVLIYLIGRELFSSRVGLLAALLACFYSMFLYFDTMLLTTNLEVFFCLLGVVYLLRWLKNKTNSHIIAAGVFWGLASITRPNFLVFVPVFTLYILFSFRKESLKQRLQPIALFVIGMLPALMAVIVINVVLGHDAVLVAWNGGINFYLGNNQFASGYSATSPELDATWWGGYKDAIIIAEKEIGQKLLPSQISHYWFMRGFNYILSKPLDWAALMLKKIYLFFNSFDLSNNQSIDTFKIFSPLLRIPLLNFGLVVVLAIWGFICSARRRQITVIYLFLLSFAFSIILFFVTARYRMPLVPFLLIFASYTVFWIIRKFKEKKHKKIVPAIITIIVIGLFVHSDLYGTHGIDYSLIHASLGNRFFASGNYRKAIEEYKEALTHDPKNTDAMNALGNTYVMLGQLNNAMQLFRKSLNIQKSADALCKLGLINVQLGRLDSAQVCFNEAAKLFSTNPEVYYYTGLYYAYSKQPKLAIENFERSLQYYPDPQYINSIHYNLYKLYLEIGEIDEAKKHLLKVDVQYKDVSKLLNSIR